MASSFSRRKASQLYVNCIPCRKVVRGEIRHSWLLRFVWLIKSWLRSPTLSASTGKKKGVSMRVDFFRWLRKPLFSPTATEATSGRRHSKRQSRTNFTVIAERLRRAPNTFWLLRVSPVSPDCYYMTIRCFHYLLTMLTIHQSPTPPPPPLSLRFVLSQILRYT